MGAKFVNLHEDTIRKPSCCCLRLIKKKRFPSSEPVSPLTTSARQEEPQKPGHDDVNGVAASGGNLSHAIVMTRISMGTGPLHGHNDGRTFVSSAKQMLCFRRESFWLGNQS